MADEYPSKWHEKYYRSERIEMLTDGVFAIVLTLLVLDLHIPKLINENSKLELWTETKKMLPHFLSFLITFLWIAINWMSGQSFRRLIIKSDALVLWIEIFMLLLVCLMPFPTALMAEYPHNPLGMVYFGVLNLVMSFLVIFQTQYTVRKNYISPHVDLDDLKKRANMIPKLMPIYILPIALAFYSPLGAQLFYLAAGISGIFQTSSWKLKDGNVDKETETFNSTSV